MDTRLSNIDFARGIAIISVTLGHILGSYRLTDSPLFYWVYSFELPLFFVASGMIAEIINKDHSKLYHYIKKQSTSILYPFLMFSLVLSAMYSIMALRGGFLNSVIRFVKCLIITFSGIGMGALWFLPTFFFACVIAYFIYSKFCKDQNLFLCTLATIVVIVFGSALSYITEYTSCKEYMFLKGNDYSSIILWNILSQLARSLVGASLVLIGRLLIKMFKMHIKTDFVMRGGTYVCIGSLLLLAGAVIGLSNYGFVDMHFSFIRNPVLFYGSAILTTLGLMMIGDNVRVRLIEWCGKYSLIIMFCQIIQEYLCKIFNKLYCVDMSSQISMKYGFTFGTLLLSMLLSMAFVYCVLRSSVLGLLISPRRKNQNV